ncbi:T9SS type A sorting domain-containing protein [Hymenobacter rubripertinctus]|uniref:T9SS C-terminal target domain-containing protein n=1 Tax=Hymenobacter rubripertinctus TaxID=2029981 RepID=A0A418QX86_9BACT|nr:T9SS type A sorting domain-containing protein [Hymenobacter rubripertinctus]RIY09759.1 T9SS C-terminal target domain-containing protein [Hymenobacter rubripertinctus]
MKKNLQFVVAGLLLATSAQAQWVRQPFTFTEPDNIPLYVDAVDNNTAWSLANGLFSANSNSVNEVARTFDGGQNWTVLAIADIDISDETIQSLSAVSATTAWVATLRGSAACRVFKTTNAGATWTVQSTSDMFSQPDSWPNTIHFFNANEGVVMGDPDGRNGGGMEIYYTANGGTTWARALNVPVGSADEYGDFYPPATVGNSIWFPNNRGDIFYSRDKGKTWGVTKRVAADPIENIAFRDELNGLATIAGANGKHQLFRSVDGGLSWAAQTYSGPLHSVGLDNVPGTGNYISVGLGGTDAGSSYSRDNGLTWVSIENNLNHLFVDAASPTAVWSGTVNVPSLEGAGANKLTSTVLPTTQAATLVLGASLSPNPSSTGQFRVQWPAAAHAGPATLTVFDALGRQVQRHALDASRTAELRLDLSQEKAGIYQVRLASGTGVSHLRAQVR